MKTAPALRILVIVLALSMLTGYVVYSQRQQSRRVAPSSKLMVLDEAKRSTNGLVKGQKVLPAVAPGSKSFAPLIAVDSKSASTNQPTNREAATSKAVIWSTKSAPVFPGSKSDRVFGPEDFPAKEPINTQKATTPPTANKQTQPKQ